MVEKSTLAYYIASNMGLRKDLQYNVARVRSIDAAAHSNKEVYLLYPHIKALFFYHFAHKAYLKKQYFRARFLSNWGRSMSGIEIHPGATIGQGLFIDHGMAVVIGETAIIGDDCLLYHGVTLGASGKQEEGRRHPKIGNRCIIGANALILGGIDLGDDVVVGANAVVTKPAQSGSKLVGMPAKNIQ